MVVGSGPSTDAPTAPAVDSGSADVSVPEVPAVASDFAGKLPSSAAEMSAAGEMEMPGPLPAAGDFSLGESCLA